MCENKLRRRVLCAMQVFGYAVYSLVYKPHKSWYSWILNTAVGRCPPSCDSQMFVQAAKAVCCRNKHGEVRKPSLIRVSCLCSVYLFGFILMCPQVRLTKCQLL